MLAAVDKSTAERGVLTANVALSLTALAKEFMVEARGRDGSEAAAQWTAVDTGDSGRAWHHSLHSSQLPPLLGKITLLLTHGEDTDSIALTP